MANEKKITITTASPLTSSDALDSITSMYPQTMITDQAVKAALNRLHEITDIKEVKIKTPEEEYIWVEGYKATDKDMKCR